MNTCPTQRLKTPPRWSNGLLGWWGAILTILLLVFLLLAPHALAATGINKQINFQGKVVNTTGTNVANGNYDFVFSIYTVASGGTAIWTETWNSGTSQVTVTDGIFRVALGTYTTFPGSIDFNTDNIYLGINFNNDGEMTPRVRFTAVPYAFNALKVAGLTVTDTTGTFTLAAAKTLTVNNTLTFAGTDATTITFQGTDTYVGRATTDTLTNKTIGSTGLTFSGATTDITTATGEDLTLVANGAGVLKLGDFTTANGVLYVSATDGTVSETAASTAAQCLQTTGAGLAPVWGACGSGSGISTVRESDLSPSVGSLTTLEFGPASTSEDEFVVTDQTGGVARVVLGSKVGKLNEAETVTGGWTFNTAATTFTTAINANGGLATSTTDTALVFTVNGAGDYTFAGDSDSNFQINATPTTDATFNSAVITLNPTGTGSTGTLQGLLISQSDNANTGVYDSLVKIENLKTPETTTNGLYIEHNAASGTLTNGLHITNTAGTLTSAITIDGTAPGSFILDTGSIDISGAGAITGATGITSATGNVAITAGDLTLNSVTRISNAGVGTFITGSVLGSQTFTTNNIADSGALTIKSGGTSALTLDTSGAAAINLGNTNATSIALGNATANPTLTLTGSGLTTLGGGLTFSGSTARTITGPNTGAANALTITAAGNVSGLTLNTAAATSGNSGVITIATGTVTTSGTSGAVNINSGASNTNALNTGLILIQSGNITTSGTSGNVGLEVGTGGTLGTINIGNATAAPINIGTSATAAKTIAIGSTAGDTIQIGSGTTTAKTIQIGNAAVANTITIGNASATGVSITDDNWSVTTAGAATFVSATSPTHTGAGAVTVSSGGSSGLTFDSASGDITVAANDGLTFAATTVGNNGSRNVTINSGTGGTTATLIAKLDTSGTVVTTDTTTLNNAVGVATNTTTAGQAARVAINGVVTATADNAVTAGDYIGVGTTTAGRAKSLGTTYPSTAGIQVIGRALGSQATPGSTFLLMLNGLDNNVAAGGGGGYNLIKEETTSLTARTTLAFLGTAMTCADNAGLTQTECTISSAGGGVSFASGTPDNTVTSNNLIHLQKSGVNKFVVANNGGLTINGTDNNVVKTTTTEFAAGNQLTNLTNANDQLELADGTVTGDGTITTAGQPPVDAAIGAGSSTILRADGKYLIIKGGSALTTSLYDSLASTFTNSQALVVAAGTVGVGSLALPRPNGMYVVILGNGVVNTSNVDPMGVVTSTAGPSLTAAASSGTVAFRRNDGRFLVTLGLGAGTTNIFDPILNTFVAGPTNSGGVAWGLGALVLPRPNGDALIVTGGSAAAVTTQAYIAMTGTVTGSGPIGTFAVGPVLPTGCEVGAIGSVAIRKPDGKYIVTAKINVSAIYDPITNAWSQNAGSCTTPTAGRGLTVALADGAHAIPLQDGRFLIIHGGALTSTSMYDPQTDLFTTGPTITAGGAGRHSIMNADGTWRLLAGGGTATNKYDTQLVMNGIYRSDDISTSNLNSNSTLRWTRESESAFTGISQGAGGPGVFTATQSAGGGSCTAGIHSYRVTYMVNGVETYGGPVSNTVTCVGGTDKVVLTNISIGPVGTTARRVYRIGDAVGFTSYKLVNGGSPTCVLGDNTTTTCTDTLADASLTTTIAGQSGAGSLSSVQFFVRTAVNSAGCATPLNNALDREITAINDFIRPASEDNCIRVTAKFSRPLPKRVVDERERGTFIGNSSTVLRLDYVTPALFDVTIDNSNVLRRSGITFNFPMPNSEFVGLAGAAPAALTAGAPSAGGSCTAGTHTWKYTYITGGQESLPSAVSAMQTCTAGNGTVALSVIAAGPTGTTARKVYRTLANDTSQYYLLTTINDNSTTTFNDTLADSALTSVIPGLEPSGPTFSRVEATEDKLYLPFGRLTPTTQVGTTGYYLGGPAASAPWSAAHPSLPQAQTNAGTIVITRPNKTFKIIASLTTPAANGAIYDPASEQFSALQTNNNIPTAANGAGGFAVKRPDGKYLVVLGNATAVTNIYDPVNDTFVLGPAIPAGVVANGGSAIPNTDGTFTIVQGNTTVGGTTGSTTSAIYDPVRNTMTAGPTLITAAEDGFFAIPLRNGMYKVIPGSDCATAGTTAAMNYDPRSKVFSAGTILTTTLPGCGTYAFQRADGWWEIIAGQGAAVGQLTTNIINPDNGTSSVGAPLVTNLSGKGGLMIPRADGTFLVLNGNGLATSNVIIPFGLGPVASALSGVTQLGAAPLGPVLSTVTGAGAVAFQRPDGKYVVINGNATQTTQLIDVGWYADGQYLSEQMKVPALVANSTLEWKQSPDNFIKMEVRAASSQAALQRTAFTSVGRPGQSFYNAGNETWVQVEVNMRREFPTWSGNLDGTYNSGGGMVFPYRTIPMPILYSYQINNGMDLLNLQSGGFNVLRVTANGGIYSSQSGGFFAGGADLAENYTSTDSLKPAEVVIADPNNAVGVLRSQGQYQGTLLGVVSTTPGFVAGSYTEDSYPIALVGRVPVKVSTENGEIKAGDSLTAATTAGYAMKTTQAGKVLGKALEPFDSAQGKECPAFDLGNPARRKCGEVMMFVNLTDYMGAPVEMVMAEKSATNTSEVGFDSSEVDLPALTNPVTQVSIPSVLNELPDNKQKILAFLKELKEERDNNGSQYSSEVFTDRVSATHEVISPQIITDILYAKKIKADSIEGLEILSGKISALRSQVAGVATSSAGLSTSEESKATSEVIAQAGSSEVLFESGKFTLDLTVLGKLNANGGLIVLGPSEFKGESLFDKLATFISHVIFKDDVTFLGRPTFNKDTAGFAVIKKDADQVEVTFDKEYAATPIVSLSMTFDPVKLADGSIEDSKVLQKRVAESNYSYFIVNRNTRGFAIVLNKNASEDLTFSWTALSVKDAKRFESKSEPTPSPSPSVTPTVTPVATSSAQLN